MPRAHDDCKFRYEWLVQDKYKEWVVKDGDPRLARCQFCMKSSKTLSLKQKKIFYATPTCRNDFWQSVTEIVVIYNGRCHLGSRNRPLPVRWFAGI